MKNVIITGTSRGIGLEMALQFAAQGHQVLAVSRKIPSALAGVANIHCLSVDITNAVELNKVSDFIKKSWTHVDILVNNAGAIINKSFEDISATEFEYIYKVNVFAVASIIQICLPYLNNGSHVVTISSMGGIQGSMKFPGLAAYSSSKGAVITLSELLAEEYKELGISFNVIALGAVQTEMLDEAFPGYLAPVEPVEMAEYIVEFSQNGNKYFNGKVLQASSTTP
ncbi:SDR family oxidoreductase [Flavobacterium sp. NKUCC04_CG]|uniref:SDR family NAD(P)-dependent oxidoreductase n=1 Tax=Flavobacterium sp. NKUCC04_CG TaxID=2842121 RepID=UPI001C5B6AAB|nr:SDR family NAD(P)-dependent oxidoreductase [Flavobacterium sp. NKUCC04_CG]MBW3517686.1 SDR family oxidoreductase [Flavobacterium sp. NKUCC04_CG]